MNDLAAFYVLPNPGYLRLSGPDKESFLQRQTSNDIRLLQNQKTLQTVLTSAVARIVDVLLLLGQSDAIDLLTLPERGAATAQFLRSRIFFNDDVKLADLSDQYAHILLLGSGIERRISQWDLEPPQNGDTQSGNLGGQLIQIMKQPLWPNPVYRLIIPKETCKHLTELLMEAEITPLSDEAFQVLRIEAGVPGPATELTEEYTPLEIGLHAAISNTKGCYTGQEIIARQLTYDKITRQMTGVKLEHPAEVGQAIWGEDKNIGKITSVVNSPKFGWIALAIIKRPYFEEEIRVKVGEAADSVNAKITHLPF